MCGGAWGNDKMVWGILGDSFFGSTRSTRSSSEHSDFLRVVDFLAIAFFEHSEQLGALGALGFFEGGDFGSTRSNSEHSDFLRVGIFGDYF